MSQRVTSLSELDSMNPTDEQRRDALPGSQNPLQPTGASFARAAAPVSDGRPSGELEGSTLGSSSREGDRRTPGQRRTQSSSSFLLESLPRARSSRIGGHRSRPSAPPAQTFNVPEFDILVPKKRSRFPWSRHKTSASESTSAGPTSSPEVVQQPSAPPRVLTSENSSRTTSSTHETGHSTPPGFDRDSIQIVNLALNLNESRKRAASGIPPNTNGRRPLSVSLPASAPVELHTPSPRGNKVIRDSSYRSALAEGLPRGTTQGGQSPVVDLLPSTVLDDNRVYEFSDRTLARAERARRHFDLFHEYLRLLPSLPPLRKPRPTDDSDSSEPSPATPTVRNYNPLQTIRNRRVRYREKCPIDAEAEGWHDVGKVHEWIDAIEKKHNHKSYDEIQIVKLPSFQKSQNQMTHGEAEDLEMTISPPASLRRVSRTNSMKAPRRRLDWKILPAELLADVAWLEDGVNKAKIVDKDGNKLYPDPTDLVLVDTDVDRDSQIQRLSVEMRDPLQEEMASRHSSLSSSRPALAPEFKSVRRGRHHQRFHSHSHSLRSRSASSSRKHSRWDKVRIRTGSISSESGAEPRKQAGLGHSRKDSEVLRHPAANSSGSHRSYGKSITAGDIRMIESQNQSSTLPSSTKPAFAHRKASFSSAGSMDDRYNPRMSYDAVDSTAPNSPAHAGYFPSIAVNLSPPSSRSPSPAKRGLRHKIVSRHERSKSKQGDRELRRHELGNLDVMAPSRPMPASLGPADHVSKLDPSPLPDVVSSSYTDEQDAADSQQVEEYRGRKGQYSTDSKLRGIFKGPGRIAEIVGNEVSKVGDLILKKEPITDSRQYSSATTLGSDDSDSDAEEKRTDKRSGPKGLLKRLPNLADESGRLTRRESERAPSSRNLMPSLPTFTSPLRQDERHDSSDALELGSPSDRNFSSREADNQEGPKRISLSRSKTLDFSPTLQSNRGRLKNRAIKDPSVPFSLTRPPVTGLAQARASPSPYERRPTLSGATRTWSISDRSLHTLNDFGVPRKTEVERTRTLLLSSGIKAREIARRAHSARDPPHWLQSSLGSNTAIPRVTRLEEFDVAAQSYLRRFEMTQYSFQQSMHHFSSATSSPLRSQLKDLEALINESLTPRARQTADIAEDLCIQLNTTSTLAVKSLSDALDKGIRKRRRRLRWVRRTGFVVLEWALVAMLWWVWLIVMAFKLLRSVFRGAVAGARWILWL
ncbi:hypothetical protein N7462_008496 [Penicillium macrosclerotiorum]|uniref:uncharacterized protein n=1 Tax=Penicillium macrosclerotiorum TaxID=303699 RepID=UPI002547651E|nr:uncharacterized protein N7462_008496 [Penicillium macrosclerotiorum]KAJ5675599.1 hypothetical protein N7462_008496 [Penicillium macrosclerotiorum]